MRDGAGAGDTSPAALPRFAVLASGRGSNLQALLDAVAGARLAARLAGVFSDRPAAPALRRVPPGLRWSEPARLAPDRAAFEQRLGDAIEACGADWVICAGYLRIFGDAFVDRFSGRLVNIHPSLLPRHRGLHTHAAALAAGDAEHGASVHFVGRELDAGPVIAQARLAVHPGEAPDALAVRVLALEHPLLVAVARLLAAGRLTEQGGKAYLDGQCLFTPLRLDSVGSLAPPASSGIAAQPVG